MCTSILITRTQEGSSHACAWARECELAHMHAMRANASGASPSKIAHLCLNMSAHMKVVELRATLEKKG